MWHWREEGWGALWTAERPDWFWSLSGCSTIMLLPTLGACISTPSRRMWIAPSYIHYAPKVFIGRMESVDMNWMLSQSSKAMNEVAMKAETKHAWCVLFVSPGWILQPELKLNTRVGHSSSGVLQEATGWHIIREGTLSLIMKMSTFKSIRCILTWEWKTPVLIGLR